MRFLLLVSITALLPAPVASAQAPEEEVVIQGRGWGHGVGMAQDGAYAMGVAGADVFDILGTFYPGTSLGRQGGTVRVSLEVAPSSIVVSFPSGGEVHGSGHSPGFPVTVSPGGSVALSYGGGSYRGEPLGGASAAPTPEPEPAPHPETPVASPTTTVPSLLGLIPLPTPTTVPPRPPVTAAPPAPEEPSEPTSEGPLLAVPREGSSVAIPSQGRRYRGTIEATAAGGGLQLVNQLDVEQYLRGMGEVLDPGWPAAALQAQAVVARTYALRAMAGEGGICNTQQCQVYLGETVEYTAMNRAVADTRGQVLLYDGSLAEAVYSANGGGITATPEEGFGIGQADVPYLPAAPYPTTDPMPWDVRLNLADLARRVGYGGTPSGIRVSRAGPSGRAMEVTVDGDAGPHVVDGHRFASTLDLRSTLFTLQAAPAQVAPGARPSSKVSRRPSNSRVLSYGGTDALGREPWLALALLLLAAWGTAARRTGKL